MSMYTRISNLSRIYQKLGWRGTTAYLAKGKINNKLKSLRPFSGGGYERYSIKPKWLPDALWLRYCSSDINVFWQVFVQEDYRHVTENEPYQTMIDCGANVGFSTSYFLTKYPTLKVVAVEPEKDNFDMLRMNTARFGSRCQPVRAAVWSRNTRAKVCSGKPGEREEWATTVKESADSAGLDVPAYDVGTLMSWNSWDTLDLLKIDVEGAEAEVFGPGCEHWLPQVKVIIIELHGQHCREVFRAATENAFQFSEAGELTFARRV